MYMAQTGTFLQRDPLPQEGEPILGYSHEAVTRIMASRRSHSATMQNGIDPNFYAYQGSGPSDVIIIEWSHRPTWPLSQYVHRNFGEFTAKAQRIFALRDRQRANLYSYTLNNPLIYTDPSGQGVVLVGAATLAIVGAFLACTKPQHDWAHERYPDSSDDFKHCWVSCRIAKTCGALTSEVAGLAKETLDAALRILSKSNEPWVDSLDDILSNQQCIPWESIVPPFGWVGSIFRQSCEDCCKCEVGYN